MLLIGFRPRYEARIGIRFAGPNKLIQDPQHQTAEARA